MSWDTRDSGVRSHDFCKDEAYGYRDLTVIDVRGLLKALDSKEQRYSVEIGQKVITEVKLELVCIGKQRTTRAVELIRKYARTGQPHAGWIYVTGLVEQVEIGE